jgi:hypothetical protein
MVNVEFPTGVPVEVVMVRMELEPAGVLAGLKEAVAPVGSPLAPRLIEPLKPPNAVVLTVKVAELAPCATEADAGDAERTKSGVGGPAGTI